MNSPSRTHPWARNERGESVVTVLVGAMIGLMVIGGFLAFWISANESGGQVASHAQQESAALQSMNRMSRDIQEATSVLSAKKDELVLQKKNKDGTYTRTFYEVTTAEGGQVLSRKQPFAAGIEPTYNPSDVKPAPNVEARDVTTNTKFAYKDKDGVVLPIASVDPSKVKLVNIDFESKAGNTGRVTLRSAAALDVSAGNTVPAGARVDPVAANDALAVTKNGAALTVNVADAPTVCPDSCTFTQKTAAPTGASFSMNSSGIATVQVTGTPTTGYTASETSPSTFTVDYAIIDASGDTDGATVTVTVNPEPKEPDAVDDNASVASGTSKTTVVLTNDRCWSNSTYMYVNGCTNPPTNPQVTVVTGPLPAGLTVVPDAQGRLVTTVAANYAGARIVPVTYRLLDLDNPALDGNDAGTTPGDDAVFTVYAGPTATNDAVSVRQGDVAGPFSLRSNDFFTAAGSTYTVSGLPAWATYNTATDQLSLNTDDFLALGAYSFTYTISTPVASTPAVTLTSTATVTITVTAGFPAITADPFAFGYNSNEVVMTGGDGNYKLYRSSTVNAAGQPTGTVTKVCDPCTSPFIDNGVTLSSDWAYTAFDSRTANPLTAAPASAKRFSSARLTQFPEDPATAATGSDINWDMVPDYQGVASVIWAARANTAQVGLKEFSSFEFFGFGIHGNPTDLGIVTGTASGACPAGWSPCFRKGGYAPGTEQIFQAYGLAPTYNTTAKTGCRVSPRSSVVTKAGYCASPSFAANNFENDGTTADGDVAVLVHNAYTDGNAAASGNELARGYQAPDAPGAGNFLIGDDGRDELVNGYGYFTRERCPDVQRGDNNRVYGCSTGVAVTSFLTNSQKGGDTGTFCNAPGDPGNCYGQFNRTSDGWVGGWHENTPNCCGGQSRVSINVGQRQWGAMDAWRGQNCNRGGCSQGPTVNVRSYPQAITVSSSEVNSNPGKQYREWWHADTHPEKGNAANGIGCWNYNPAGDPNYCADKQYPTLAFSWPASQGADHISLGGYQNIGNSWDADRGGGACYNFGLRARWRNDDPAANGSPAVHADGDIPVGWMGDAQGNGRYQSCRWYLGGDGLGTAGSVSQGVGTANAAGSTQVYVPTTAVYTVAADPVGVPMDGQPGLRQRSSKNVWTSAGRPTFIGDAPFCHTGYGGWQYGFKMRPSVTATLPVGGTEGPEQPSYMELYYWQGYASTGNFFVGLNDAASSNAPTRDTMLWSANDNLVNTWQNRAPYNPNADNTGPGGSAIVNKMGWGINSWLLHNGNTAFSAPMAHDRTIITSWRSYTPTGDWNSADAGNGWSWRTSQGLRWTNAMTGVASGNCDPDGFGLNRFESNGGNLNWSTPRWPDGDPKGITWKAAWNDPYRNYSPKYGSNFMNGCAQIPCWGIWPSMN